MKQCCVAYIGGGNALLLFAADGEDRRLEVVRRFTRRLLIERPGLRVGVALGKLTLNLDDQSLDQNDIAELYQVLKRNQNSVFPAVNVPYTGLTRQMLSSIAKTASDLFRKTTLPSFTGCSNAIKTACFLP